MADNIAKITIQAEDQASKQLQDVANGLKATQEAAAGTTKASRDLSESFQIVKTSFERADPEQFAQKFRQTTQTLSSALQPTNVLAESTKELGRSLDLTAYASQGLTIALGILGVQSAIAVANKLYAVAQESFGLAVSLQGVEARAEAVFGSSFPQMEKAASHLADEFHRSHVEVLSFETGFGTALSNIGVAPAQVDSLSQSLVSLTENLGKVYPDKSDDQIYHDLLAGVEGYTKGLKDLNFVVDDATLKDVAHKHGIDDKLSSFSQMQRSQLILIDVLSQAQKFEDAAAKSTGNLGDSAKTAGGAWKDFETELGKDASPTATAVLSGLTYLLRDFTERAHQAAQAYGTVLQVVSGAAFGFSAQKFKAFGPELPASFNPADHQPENPLIQQLANQIKQEPNLPGGGGGSKLENSEEAEYTKLLGYEKQLQDDILRTMGEQAKSNKDRLTQERV
jgi:hypothetical protein